MRMKARARRPHPCGVTELPAECSNTSKVDPWLIQQHALPIEYGPYVASDADAMTRLLADAFSRYDPLAFAVGVTASDFEGFVRPLCPKVAAEGLTYVARRSDTGQIVGVLLTEDAAVACSRRTESTG